MTDRELLEAAAKAAGITLRWIQGPNDDECIHPIRRRDDGMCEVDWNPLTDDGDALRLAVTLNMGVSIPVWKDNRIDVITFRDSRVNVIEKGNDAMAATRRAIVRAAAEIGAAAKKGTP